MGRGRYIYITDELEEKLKKEKNVSGLIQGLLATYYHNLEKPVLSVLEELDIEEKQETEAERKEKEKIEQHKDNFKVILGLELTDDEVKSYIPLFESGKEDIYSYGDKIRSKKITA
jgi:hypothetical protein